MNERPRHRHAQRVGPGLDTALKLFQWTHVARVPAAIFAVAVVAGILANYIRKRII